MKIELNLVNEIPVAEILSDELVITNTEDGLDLLGNVYYQGFDRVIIYENNITPDFFNLKTGLAVKSCKNFRITGSAWPLSAHSAPIRVKVSTISFSRATVRAMLAL